MKYIKLIDNQLEKLFTLMKYCFECPSPNMHNVSIKFSNYCYNGDTINIHKLIETIIVHRIDKLNFVLLLPNILFVNDNTYIM